MCGINVSYGSKWLPDDIDQMNQNLKHRGPDASGMYTNEKQRISLGSTRLKIIDLESGDMPYHSPCGRFHMVFNGEVYNYKELRETCFDYSFSSNTDGEVLFALLQKKGPDAIKLCNGMFSFAFYDSEHEILLIARDRLGIKPLFYSFKEGHLLVSSEIPALQSTGKVSSKINRQAFHHYASLLCVPEPYSMYQDIKRFPKAHYAIVKNHKLKFHKYWDISFQKKQHSTEEWSEVIQSQFEESIQKRLIADVPVGVMLSGGVDSTIIAETVSRLDKSKAKTYSMAFEDGDNENVLAEKTAQQFGLEHKSFTLKAKDLLDTLPNIVSHFDEPFAGGLPMWFLCKEVSQYVTVALSGTGGDEMFGNYGRIKHLKPYYGLIRGIKSIMRLKSYKQASIESLRYQLLHGAPIGHFFHEKTAALKEWQKQDLLLSHDSERTDLFLEEDFWNHSLVSLEDRLFNHEMKHQLVDEFLFSQDILSMAHHLEVRVPFLDHTFVELMASVPVHLRSEVVHPKVFMKNVFKNSLPDHILNKPKSGFMVPYGAWMRNELRSMVEELFSEKNINEHGFINARVLQTYWREHLKGTDHSYRLWPLVVFQLWLHQQK